MELIFPISLLMVALHLLIRNHNVGAFSLEIVDKAFGVLDDYLEEMKEKHGEEFIAFRRKYSEVHDFAIYIVNKNSYRSMIWSLKPLKLKYWFTEKEIEFLTKGTYETDCSKQQ